MQRSVCMYACLTLCMPKYIALTLAGTYVAHGYVYMFTK